MHFRERSTILVLTNIDGRLKRQSRGEPHISARSAAGAYHSQTSRHLAFYYYKTWSGNVCVFFVLLYVAQATNLNARTRTQHNLRKRDHICVYAYTKVKSRTQSHCWVGGYSSILTTDWLDLSNHTVQNTCTSITTVPGHCSLLLQ